MSKHTPFTRREFIGTGVAAASTAITPRWLQTPAWAQETRPGPDKVKSPSKDHRIIVVIELSGGNDGLNTVVPYGLREYYRARPRIAIDENQVLKLRRSEGIGLHPELSALRTMIGQGIAGIVQGVGYPRPNRSHEGSRRIWHTASTLIDSGWLTRALELTSPAQDDLSRASRYVAIGRNAPLMLQKRLDPPLVIQDPQQAYWTGSELNEVLARVYDQIQSIDGSHPRSTIQSPSQLDYVTAVSQEAQALSGYFSRNALKDPLTSSSGGRLADQLRLVATMIRAGLPTRAYFVSMDGFDTHAKQVDQHAQTLWQFASGVHGFYKELTAMNQQHRVLTMAFSEFGRRVAQNASDGTDHGTAGPLFLFGTSVEPGLIGSHPSLSDLDDGDLRYTTDFRSVYATILNQWLEVDSTNVLGAAFKPTKIFKT